MLDKLPEHLSSQRGPSLLAGVRTSAGRSPE